MKVYTQFDLPILNDTDIKNSLMVLNSGNKRREYWFGAMQFRIVSIDSINPKMVISHQYPNIVTKISKENAQ